MPCRPTTTDGGGGGGGGSCFDRGVADARLGPMAKMLLVALLLCRRKRCRANAMIPEILVATVATVEASAVVFLRSEEAMA